METFLVYHMYELVECRKHTEYKYENLFDNSEQSSIMIRFLRRTVQIKCSLSLYQYYRTGNYLLRHTIKNLNQS